MKEYHGQWEPCNGIYSPTRLARQWQPSAAEALTELPEYGDVGKSLTRMPERWQRLSSETTVLLPCGKIKPKEAMREPVNILVEIDAP